MPVKDDSSEELDDFFQKYFMIQNMYNYDNSIRASGEFVKMFDFKKPLTMDNQNLIEAAIFETVAAGKYKILDFLIRTYDININMLDKNPDLLTHALRYCGNDPISESNIVDHLGKRNNVSIEDYISVIDTLIEHNHEVNQNHIDYVKNKGNCLLLIFSQCFPIGKWAKIYKLIS